MAEPIVELLDTEWRAISDAVRRLRRGRRGRRPSRSRAGPCKDCLSHVAGTEWALLGDPSRRPSTSQHLEHVVSPFQELTEAPVEHRPVVDRRAGARRLPGHHRQRVDAARGDVDEELDEVGWSPLGEVPYRDVHGGPAVRLLDARAGHAPRRRPPGPLHRTRGRRRPRPVPRRGAVRRRQEGRGAGGVDGRALDHRRLRAVLEHHGDPTAGRAHRRRR